MPIITALPKTIKINGIITYRRKIPPALQGEASGKLLEAWKAAKSISFGRKCMPSTNIISASIKISLETKDDKTAQQRWTVAHTAVEALFSAQETTSKPVLLSLTADKIEMVGDFHQARRLEADNSKRELISAIDMETNRLTEDNIDFPPALQGEPLDIDKIYDDLEAHTDAQQAVLRKVLARSNRTKQEAIAEKILRGIGIEKPRTLPEFHNLVPALIKGEKAALDAISRRNAGDIVDVPSSKKVAKAIVKTDLLFSTVRDKFLREQKLSAKRLDDVVFILRDWIDVVGDKNIDQYKKANGRKYKEVLLDLPPNWKKKKETRHLPILKAAEKARKLGMETQSPTTINKKLRAVGQVFNWAIANNDEDILNPVPTGMLVKNPTSAVDDRRPFSPEELTRIIAEISNDKEEYKWIVLIGMFTGARLNEICNLLPTDILEKEGLRAFSFHADNGKRKIKNKASVRIVPLHPMLEKLGFGTYATRMKNRKRLFPSLKPDKYGYLSDAIGDKFNRMLEKLSIKPADKAAPKVDFHSWRHTFKKHCEHCDIRFEHCEAMLGHTLTSMGARYGDRDRYGLELLSQKLEMLKFDGVDFAPVTPK